MEKITIIHGFTKHRRLLASALIAITILFFINAAHPGAKHFTVIAVHDIGVGAKIKASDIRVVSSSQQWEGQLTTVASAQGRYATSKIDAGEPLTQSLIKNKVSLDPLDTQAVSVTVPASENAANLHDGDRVNVYAANDLSRAQLVAQHALVLKVSSNTSSTVFNANNSSHVMLAVNQNQLPNLATYMGNGQFTFAVLPD
jgi:Flp pilus assembly protein CpaB